MGNISTLIEDLILTTTKEINYSGGFSNWCLELARWLAILIQAITWLARSALKWHQFENYSQALYNLVLWGQKMRFEQKIVKGTKAVVYDKSWNHPVPCNYSFVHWLDWNYTIFIEQGNDWNLIPIRNFRMYWLVSTTIFRRMIEEQNSR